MSGRLSVGIKNKRASRGFVRTRKREVNVVKISINLLLFRAANEKITDEEKKN